ncbi:hypothetical protein C5B96_05850 [Subtercola sp. Z020]|nr:hypothetical protein C5B96_05850 [Subtercola sp. Z020]
MRPDDGHPVASLSAVTVRAPGRAVPLLDEVSVVVREGERMIVIGPSGSGKSSLLQVLTGVIPLSVNLDLEGFVEVGGVDAAGLTVMERSRLFGVVAQNPAASVCLARVDQEVALPLENHGVPPAEIAGRVGEALRRADAESLRDRGTAELSGGELQRVTLAAALAARPAVLLLDEPTSMLDPAGIRAVRASIAAITGRREGAVVLIEHRLDEFAGADGVDGLPERALLLADGGRVWADGPTAQVLRENAAMLHDTGCWLPLDIELLAVTGHPGGLPSEPVRAWLRAAADAPEEAAALDVSADGDAAAGHPAAARLVLAARSLAVGYGMPGRTRAGRRRAARSLLRGVDLTVHPGEIVALLGANGSGKSSLLLTLAGLLPAQAGSVEGPRPGMVFQNPEYQFLAHRVRDEIAVGLPGSRAEVAEVVGRQLAAHRLEHVADHDPHRLSGGEKRRLSLAAMLAHRDRPVLLADEPTFALDRQDTVATALAFRREAHRGRAIVFSGHDLRFVAAVAHRVIVVAGGEVVADGPTGDVLQNAEVLGAAGLEVPSLVSWLLGAFGAAGAARALRRLYDARSRTGAAAPTPTEVTR